MFKDRTMKKKLPSALAAFARSIPACLSLAGLTLTLFACLENTNAPNDTGLSPGLNQPPNNGGQEQQARQYIYCVFPETEMCLAGPFEECHIGGSLSNECPPSYHGAGSGADINPNENGMHNYCIIPENKICLEGPFSECHSGQPANECPYVFSSSSSEAAISSSSSKENAISSSSEEIAIPTPNSSSSSSSSSISSSSGVTGPSLCEGFNPNEEVLHEGRMKKQICDERDGTRYVYVKIGKQTWFAQNLRHVFNDSIGVCKGYCFDGSYGCLAECDEFGGTYSMVDMFCNGCGHGEDLGCPDGWHLPATYELEELLTYADPDFVPGSEAAGAGLNSAAIKLKTTLRGGTDEYGFSVLAASNGARTFYLGYGFGYPVPLNKSWCVASGSAAVSDAYQSNATSKFYVRCIKKESRPTPTPETPPTALTCTPACTGSQTCHLGTCKDVFKDPRDSQDYPYVTIGNKTWMAANLNFNASEGSVCYNNLTQNCTTYGRLYNWNAMMAGDAYSTTNEIGPSGYGLPSAGNIGGGVNFGTVRGSFFWGTGSQNANGSQIMHLGPTSANAKIIDNDKSRLYSVRCVKD